MTGPSSGSAQRSERPRLVLNKINCAALPRELLASELFGHERGAFTDAIDRRPGLFAAADGGTLFADEIGNLSPEGQAMLPGHRGRASHARAAGRELDGEAQVPDGPGDRVLVLLDGAGRLHRRVRKRLGVRQDRRRPHAARAEILDWRTSTQSAARPTAWPTICASEGPGFLLGFGHRDEPAAFNTEVDWSLAPRVVERAVHRAPALAEARLMRAYAGLCEMTPDQTGIVSAVPGVDGLVVVAGFSGHGFMHGSIAGQLMPELIADGRAVTVDISLLDIQRFARGETPIEAMTFL